MVKIKRKGSKVVIKPEDDLTDSEAFELRKELLKLLSESVKKFKLLFDLEKITYIDSKGLAILIALYNSLKEKGETLEIINVSEEIFKLFNTLKINEILNVSEKQ
ncbi:MAG: STAS domain-containing protein [Thermodesulfobacteriota bacterium]|nr:STAS domain-containing protein [Thermodesulfobacteriota bacterium]